MVGAPSLAYATRVARSRLDEDKRREQAMDLQRRQVEETERIRQQQADAYYNSIFFGPNNPFI